MKASQIIQVNGSIKGVTRDGSFRYGIYRDGSIAEFYGKIVFLENTGTAVQPRNIPGFKNELIEGY